MNPTLVTMTNGIGMISEFIELNKNHKYVVTLMIFDDSLNFTDNGLI